MINVKFVDVNVTQVMQGAMDRILGRQSLIIGNIIRVAAYENNQAVVFMSNGDVLLCAESQATVCLNMRGADLPIG